MDRDRKGAEFKSTDEGKYTERFHFLSQVLHETENLIFTIEQAGGGTWEHAINTASNTEWNCSTYYEAIESDTDYFNNQYENSKNSYKAACRGRCFIHITHCYNYLGFFYHKAALNAGDIQQAEKVLDRFHYIDSDGRYKRVTGKVVCERVVLENVREYYERGFYFEPEEVVNEFEKTMNRLSLPCNGINVPPMSSLTFLTDSAFWYWKKCQQAYPYLIRTRACRQSSIGLSTPKKPWIGNSWRSSQSGWQNA